jgi:hypothetical protein
VIDAPPSVPEVKATVSEPFAEVAEEIVGADGLVSIS